MDQLELKKATAADQTEKDRALVLDLLDRVADAPLGPAAAPSEPKSPSLQAELNASLR